MTGPLFFHHIPKTGGASLINLLRGAISAGSVFTEPSNALSAGYTAHLAAAALPPEALIHGHPDWGACRPFRGSARFITLLREPRRQIVSHFQHALRDPAMPQHAAARALGLRAFLRAYIYNIPFQTHALYRSITDPDVEWHLALRDPGYGDAFEPERYFAAQHRAVSAFLDEMVLVGTLETIDDFITCLTNVMGWRGRPDLLHDNRAAPEQRAETASLLDQIAELEREAALAPLFAIEQATYCKAQSLALAGMARHLREGGLQPKAVMKAGDVLPADNFAAEGPQNWWTGSRQLSRLRIAFDRPGAWRLILCADRLHGVTPQELMLCSSGRWLDVAVSETMQGSTSFSVIVVATEATSYLDVWLYLQWNRYPAQPPYYPAIRFTKIAAQPVDS